MQTLSDLQRDALAEIFNIGVGRAADSLSQIVNDQVLLSAPSVRLVPAEKAASELIAGQFRKLSSVTQIFTGPFEAQATLLFPESNALEIVRLMVGPHMSIEELCEFEQEAMCEVGNIILNACMSSLADLFRVSFEGTLPTHTFCDSETVAIVTLDEQHMVLILQVDLIISQQRVEGHILFLLSVSSMASLIDTLNRYLAEQGLC